MAIQTFKCPKCGWKLEKIVKRDEEVYCPECETGTRMKQIWSVPATPQWGPGVRNF